MTFNPVSTYDQHSSPLREFNKPSALVATSRRESGTMEAQMHRQGHETEHHQPSLASVLQSEQQHDEKKPAGQSVLKKVKNKAKKIKDTLTKKHGHEGAGSKGEERREHVGGEYHRSHDVEEEEEEDEEYEEGAEVHGAPIYDNTAVRSIVEEGGPNLGETGGTKSGNLPGDTSRATGTQAARSVGATAFTGGTGWPGLGAPATADTDETTRLRTTRNFGAAAPTKADTGNRPLGTGAAAPTKVDAGSRLGIGITLEEDPSAPKPRSQGGGAAGEFVPGSYQSSVTDTPYSSGRVEPGVICSVNVPRGDPPEVPVAATGPLTDVPEEQYHSTTATETSKPDVSEEQELQGQSHRPKDEHGYAEKLSAVATSVKEVLVDVARGITATAGGGAGGLTGGEHYRRGGGIIADEVHVPYGTGMGPRTGTDKGISVKEFLAEKLQPGAEDRALGEVISEGIRDREEGVLGAVKERAAGVTTVGRGSDGVGSVGGEGFAGKVKSAVTSVLGAGDTGAAVAVETPGEEIERLRLKESGKYDAGAS